MEDSPDSHENGLDSEKSTPDGAVKINKQRLKVWDKVSWFRRKNRTNEEDSITQQFIISNTDSIEENQYPFILDAALNPVLCKSSASNFSDCSLSSDEGEYSCLSDVNDLNGNPIMPITQSPSPEELSRTSTLEFCHGFKESSKVTYKTSFIDEENHICKAKWENIGSDSSCSKYQSNSMKNINLLYSHQTTHSSNEDEETAKISSSAIFQSAWDNNQQICETYRGLSNFKVFNNESDTCFASNKDLHAKDSLEESVSVVDALFEPDLVSTCNIQLRQKEQHGSNLSEVRKSYSLPHHYKHGGGDNTNEINAITKCQQKRRHLAWGKELFKMKSTSLTWVCSCPESSTCKDESVALSRYSLPEKSVNPSEFKDRLKTVEKWFTECNEEQKNLMLKMLLEHCDTAQNHLLSVSLEPILHHLCPPNCQDLLSWLPSHLTLYILSFLDAVSLAQCSRVCRSWYSLANEPCLWQRFCKDPTWQLSPSADKKQLDSWKGQDGQIRWKKAFSERFRLRRNWLKGYCHVRTFEGHTQGISCVQFDDTRIVSGSSDKTIKVWNIRTNSQWSVMTLVGHSGTVRCLHLEGSRLVSGSTDRTIKVWDLSSQHSWSSIACKVTMIGHTDTVRCLQVDDEKVVSGSYDRTLKVWDIRTGHCRLTLQSHEAAVLCLQFDNQKIVSGSCDNTIKIWNLEAGICVDTLHGHQDAVTCLQFNDSRILSGSLDRTIKFWSLQTGQCLRTLDWMKSEGHTGVIRCLQADSWRFVSGGDDKSLKVWSLETGQRLVTLRNHTDGVTCLQFNDNIIVSGSYDKTVKLWDFSVC